MSAKNIVFAGPRPSSSAAGANTMNNLSNLPPGCPDGPHNHQLVKLHCKNKHEWFARMYKELGGCFFEDDDEAFCPFCEEEACPEK